MLTPIQAQKLASDLFDDSATALLSHASGEAPLPEHIGGYRIIRQIATGGMGTVYEAVQERPRRTVALKVLKPGIISRETLRRFQYEADILARLQHPGIAQVYAAGTHDDGSGGVPYFVMEYLPNALPITDFVQQHDLSLHQRLELFTQVCDAVHYGHQKGFIHRDLKPANILVTSDDSPSPAEHGITTRVKIIDFGIARATDSDTAVTTMITDAREIIGTLQYMSPEQCEGNPAELDVRSDVYSLGVVLYELLCGQLPYNISGTTIAGAAKMIQEKEPTRPSAIMKRLRGDVETIVLKALEKDRAKRYQCAVLLAEDVRRYLRGEAIEARKPTAWSRTMRWAARHPKASTASLCAAMVATTTISLALTNWHLRLTPDRIKVSDDSREVSLISMSGNKLKTWKAPGRDGFQKPLYVDSSDQLGPIVLLPYGQFSDVPEAGSLCAYAVQTSVDRPAWTARIGLEELPENLRVKGAHFGANIIDVDDVFPERAGLEVIAAFIHSGSSGCAICVYDIADGTLLYRAWHDGSFDALWLSKPKLVVAAGNNCEVYAKDRSYPYSGPYDNHPRVIFAVRPSLGHIATVWTTPYGITADGQVGETATLAWYVAFPAPELGQQFVLARIGPPGAGYDPREHFMVTLEMRDRSFICVDCVFDATGKIVARRCSDSWRNDPTAPAPSIVDTMEPMPLPLHTSAVNK